MAVYTIWVLAESNISITGTRVVGGTTVPKSLDGINQGDGSHLDGEFLTINGIGAQQITVDDSGTETFFADNDGGQDLAADVDLDGTTYTAGTRIEAEYQFVLRDDATGIEYTAVAVNISNSSPSYATNEAIAFVGTAPPANVPLRVISSQEGPPNSAPNGIDASEFVPICFCAGTEIATPKGGRAVETLQPGDKIATADGGIAVLKCVFKTTLSLEDLRGNPKLYPVCISSGSLGLGLPIRDLLVSRQHRMLVSSDIAERMFNERDVLVPATKLSALPGIYVDDSLTKVTYFHLLFEQHELILAEGAPTESLFTGPEALKSLMPEAREEIIALFPQIAEEDYAPAPARFIPTGRKQKQLIARHLQNEKPTLM